MPAISMFYGIIIKLYNNGEQKLYDARPLLAKSIYKPLNNLSFF